ncbi:hypothetical protein FGO68_gene13788 [Halteria grandinella]|uniref:Uncharacterized protein n=1 Tax=Halteria grandinella TaxID=5974 RepID=A0A8J8NJD7_HALGN|nr:hypothetical protein FGO68_gene13788 [Halteria grandinella]
MTFFNSQGLQQMSSRVSSFTSDERIFFQDFFVGLKTISLVPVEPNGGASQSAGTVATFCCWLTTSSS